ncbi:DNA utilization protein GntX [compost metagenome]
MSLDNRLPKGLGFFHRLLSPSGRACLVCGRERRLSVRLPGICSVCEQSVPWIIKPRCRKCGRPVGCPDCARGYDASALLLNRSAVAYSSDMRNWIGEFKYRGDERYGELLGAMLDHAYELLKSELESRRGTKWKADLLIPVPVSEARLLERGFNQAGRLAEVLSLRRKIPVMELLGRTRHTGKQSFKGRAERIKAMKEAFIFNNKKGEAFARQLREREVSRIVIIDDIYTTGSTIHSCAEVIQRTAEAYGGHIEICSLTWARS